MQKIILKASNISKQYRLGLVGTGTLSHDLNRWWHNVRGKPDPYLKVGEVNDRSQSAKGDYVWALKDINFEVKQGEVLGIIGKNGAGKSTLLKLLSRVTLPTTGEIKTKGRIASLLEVGTGFHPELTGRENIYLNGAILGMTKAEIKSKEQEIIAFSGCEMYIDTPVKRYSSGMRVRLAFAVAAHLEPDILVIDEVLAVGDAEFQKKALGKMKDISGTGGRTVLFVSHNMAAVKSLCTRVLLIENGNIISEGSTESIINKYLQSNRSKFENGIYKYNYKKEALYINQIQFLNEKGEIKDKFSVNNKIRIKILVSSVKFYNNIALALQIFSNNDVQLLSSFSTDTCDLKSINKGTYALLVEIPSNFLNIGIYRISIIAFIPGSEIIQKREELQFEIAYADASDKAIINRKGLLMKELKWDYEKID